MLLVALAASPCVWIQGAAFLALSVCISKPTWRHVGDGAMRDCGDLLAVDEPAEPKIRHLCNSRASALGFR